MHILLVAVSLAAAMPAALAQGDAPDAYLLRPMDHIAILVWDEPTFSMPDVQIRPDGKITHSFLGDISAAGKTPEQLSREITRLLRRELRNPLVTVSVIDFMTNQVFVTGAVQEPGAFSVADPLTVSQAVANAGGVLAGADLSKAVVIYRDGKREEIDLEAELTGAQGSGRPYLRGGATLFVYERRAEVVAVLGAVNKPGMFDIAPEGLRLSDAIALADGLAQTAEAQESRLTRRDGTVVTVDIAQVCANPGDSANVALKHGDALYIPTAIPRTFSILGQVATPSVQPMVTGKVYRLSDAIALAGGMTPAADQAAARLLRADGSVTEVDLTPVLKGVSPAQDIELQPGDTVFIPELSTYVVLGSVNRPGGYPLVPNTRISDAIAAAGGLSLDPPGTEASVIHADGTSADIDINQVLGTRETGANRLMAANDTLVVRARKEPRVAILGAVANPGSYPLQTMSRVADALATAACTDTAGSTAALWRADGSTVTLTLSKRSDLDIELADGDIIAVEQARYVTVLGEVTTPQRILWSEGHRIADVLAQAGGLKERLNLLKATLLRSNSTVVEVDLASILERKDPAANILVEGGDTFIVSAMPQRFVAVLGSVNAPGYYPIQGKESIAVLLARAGGVFPESSTSSLTLMRPDGSSTRFNLGELLDGSSAVSSPEVEDGSILVVEAASDIAVIGAVAKPGIYPSGPDTRIATLIAQAGPLLPTADPRGAAVVHPDGTRTMVDLTQILSGNTAATSALLTAGDVLVIPELIPIMVVGAVTAPGPFSLPQGAGVSELLARAGGAQATADLRRVTVIRQDGSRTTVDTHLITPESADEADVHVYPGDVVFVPEKDCTIAVIGGVKAPGLHQVFPGATITDALAAANGTLPNVTIASCSILRGTDFISVDVRALLQDKQTSANVPVMDGDTIIFEAEAQLNVAVLGAVRTPRLCRLPAGSRLSMALAETQGFTDDADQQKVKLIRGGTQELFDFSAFERNAKLPDDPLLETGDLVVVPESQRYVTVLGVVKNQGVYRFDPGDTVMDAVARLAGGWIEKQSAANRTVLSRRLGDEIGVTQVDLLAIAKGASQERNPQIENGDIIYVPTVSQHTLKGILDVLFPVASVTRLFGLD